MSRTACHSINRVVVELFAKQNTFAFSIIEQLEMVDVVTGVFQDRHPCTYADQGVGITSFREQRFTRVIDYTIGHWLRHRPLLL